MSLDLFANFERASNGALFYRTTSSAPYTITYKLSDLSLPQEDLAYSYDASYSIDGNAYVSFPSNSAGEYILTLSYFRDTPDTRLFKVRTNPKTNPTDVTEFDLSVVFVSEFPVADFVLYPTTKVIFNEETQSAEIGEINSTNYTLCSEGARFYGEGHSETFVFNSTQPTNSYVTHWFVGSPLSAFWEGQTTTGNSATLTLSTVSNELSVRPVHMIKKPAGEQVSHVPVITFNDIDGSKEFYPFFASTLNTKGTENTEQNTTLKQSISVLRYPELLAVPQLSTTYETELQHLPFDYSSRFFVTSLLNDSTPPTILTKTFSGSMWSLSSVSQLGTWGGLDDEFSTTGFLSGITAYQFSLGYQKETESALNYYKVSPLVDSSLTLAVTSYTDVVINLEPFDWINRAVAQTSTVALSTFSFPYTTIYTPNYYNLENTPISLEFVTVLGSPDLLVTKVEASSNLETVSSLVIETSGGYSSLSGTLTFTEPGVADLYVDVHFFNAKLSSSDVASFVFPTLFEIISDYDSTDERFYQTSLTPIEITHKQAPKLSPNEWAIADNVNSIFEKINLTTEELERYTNLVVPKNKFTGALELSGNSQTEISYGRWKNKQVDFADFPLTDCNFQQNAQSFIDIAHVGSTNFLIIAHPTTINVVSNTRTPVILSSKNKATDVYSFQNIIAIESTINDRLVVLDDVLLTVSVFQITETGQLNLLHDWGGFGSVNSATGFKEPVDIHVDQSESIYVTDIKNKCIKKYAINGKHSLTLTSSLFDEFAPKGVCVDSDYKIHCLTESKIIVFDEFGTFLFDYGFPTEVSGVTKINTSYNRETLYISYETGVIKYFKTGTISNYILSNYRCADGTLLTGISSLTQTKFRNVFVTCGNKILKIADVTKTSQGKFSNNSELIWKLETILVHPNEYIQPWVYLKGFHRLWDNIEILRNSLFYKQGTCKQYRAPKHKKEQLTIGQNELVTNSVINRLSGQLWDNLSTIIEYFASTCTENTEINTTK